MRRVAEIIYVTEENRQSFIDGAINPDIETQEILWLCGVRKQQYFALNELLFMTFEYEGNDFNTDMSKMASYLDKKGLLIKKRRKDVPLDMRDKVDWWAPVKRLGSVLDTKPGVKDEAGLSLMAMLDGAMVENDEYNNIAFDEDDWSEGFHF